MTKTAAALTLVPDDPGFVDLRGLLLSGRADVVDGGDPEHGFVAISWDFPFGATWGRPSPEVILTATTGRTAYEPSSAGEGFAGDWNLLVPAPERNWVARVLPRWTQRPVTLHRWSGTAIDHVEGPALRLFAEGHHGELDTTRLSPEFRHELELEWVASRPLAAAFDDDRLLSVCFAPLETETLWDVAVETVPDARRRGLAAACFHVLHRHQRSRRRIPVWGALDKNVASMRLAARLGFEPTTRIVSFVAPDSDS